MSCEKLEATVALVRASIEILLLLTRLTIKEDCFVFYDSHLLSEHIRLNRQ
jgi:hypothetical protein